MCLVDGPVRLTSIVLQCSSGVDGLERRINGLVRLTSIVWQCSSGVRPVRQDVADLLQPNELEEALARARASYHTVGRQPL